MFLAYARQGWPGAPHPCVAEADCYCEAARTGWIRQPANTWSCLAGVLVGLGIAASAGGGKDMTRAGPGANRMRADPFYPALYACIVVYSGIGAAFFHASLTDWGGKLDMASMVLSFGFWLAYNVTRARDLTRGRFLALFLGLAAVLLVPRVVFGVLGLEIFAGLVAAVLVSEVLVARSPLRIERRWLWIGLALYLPALLVWWLSLSGHPLCDPASLLQGHAVWHVITALSPAALYLYFRDGEIGGPRRVAGSERADRRRLAAALCGAGAAVSALAVPVVAARAGAPYSHVSQYISELGATGEPHAGLVALLGFAPTGLLLLAFLGLAAGIFPPSRRTTAGVLCLAAVPASYLAAAIFPCDPGCPGSGSLSQSVHNAFGLLEYVGAVPGLVLLGTAFRRSAPWRPLSRASLVAALLAALGFLAMLAPPLEPVRGLSQRLAEASIFLWVACASVFLLRLGPPAQT